MAEESKTQRSTAAFHSMDDRGLPEVFRRGMPEAAEALFERFRGEVPNLTTRTTDGR